MKSVVTGDGSITLYSENYQDHFHSKSGALEESFKKFVEPCNLKPGAVILDIGFGLGYNILEAIHSVKNIRVTSLEKDENVLKEVQNINVPEHLEKDYDTVKKAAKNLHYKDDDVEIEIVLGDAVETVKILKERFDAVFLDPFSPLKNPELWTEEFFKDVKKLMKKDVVLATYSCARSVRENLKNAGFLIKDGPVVGRRGPSTLAINI
ncbi:MAG: MnmC family methyltransferase [Nanoarchaeota archaeon]|nr:MnmC family methyltransferase [Nanoarchaeota archaeon]